MWSNRMDVLYSSHTCVHLRLVWGLSGHQWHLQPASLANSTMDRPVHSNRTHLMPWTIFAMKRDSMLPFRVCALANVRNLMLTVCHANRQDLMSAFVHRPVTKVNVHALVCACIYINGQEKYFNWNCFVEDSQWKLLPDKFAPMPLQCSGSFIFTLPYSCGRNNFQFFACGKLLFEFNIHLFL